MDKIYILSAVRTAIGSLGGSLKNVNPECLASVVIEQAILKSGVPMDELDEVILGQTKQSADSPNIARIASLIAGLPEGVPGFTVHRQCGSGLQAIISAVHQIRCGDADVVVAGGVESMSTAQYYLRGARYGYKIGNATLVDPNTESQPKSQPEDRYGYLVMGMTAENIAEKYNISREEQDRFAYRSQVMTISAMDSGRFKDEIVPVLVHQKKENSIIFDTDEYPKRDASLEKLARLMPVFKNPGGTVTAGNSSGRNDGAAAVVLASERAVKKLTLKPMLSYVASASAGVDPRYMGIGPVPAIRSCLKRAGLALSDIGLVEINEAFAAQSVACANQLGLKEERLNVNGGAISLGHPLGCSGTRIAVTLGHEMLKRGEKYGLLGICIAGGQGLAMVLASEQF